MYTAKFSLVDSSHPNYEFSQSYRMLCTGAYESRVMQSSRVDPYTATQEVEIRASDHFKVQILEHNEGSCALKETIVAVYNKKARRPKALQEIIDKLEEGGFIKIAPNTEYWEVVEE